MLVYNYDPITFEYTSSEEAGKNPLKADEPIIPSCATIIKPLKPKDKNAIVWIGNKWKYKPDHRKELWYNAKTKQIEIIDFIGELPNYYFTPDSPIANIPDENYYIFDSELQKWVGDPLLYKQYILETFEEYWELKLEKPFEFENYRYIPSWRDLYSSIYLSLKEGIKKEYRLQDYDGKYNIVNVKTMKPIYAKMAEILDEMYIDKQNLEIYFKKENDFVKLETKFNEWLQKEYK